MDKMDRPMKFWSEWFGGFSGREVLVFSPFKDRRFIKFDELPPIIKEHEENGLPVFLSVQPFKGRDTPSHLEKLFFDFDDPTNPSRAIEEGLRFARTLKEFYSVEPFLTLSGSKGCHVYVFFSEPVSINGLENYAKEAMRVLQSKLLMGLNLKTVDRNPLGDVKRISRLPYTIHEETQRLCQPIDEREEALSPEDVDLSFHKKNGLNPSLLKPVIEEIFMEEERRRQTHTSFKPTKGIRKEVQLLIERAEKRIELSHEERLAILFEMLNAGYGDDDIHAVFMNQPDYNAGKTQYFIDHARKRRYKPFSKSRLDALLEGRGKI
ncbi:MAG: hypothetical protein QXX41_07595 [Nitrososphaerota archaeon]